MDLNDKISIVRNILKNEKTAIGFSGGADSTLLAYLSSKYAEDTLAITVDNHLMPNAFIENAQKIAESFKINHEIIDIDFYENKNFLSNDAGRCFICRNIMYDQIKKTANEKGYDFICDGNNISDLVINRPGILITYEKEFKTPLIEAKLTSKEIHEYLNKNSIPYSKSTTCLATRIPINTPATYEKIKRIGYCEDYISSNTDCEIVKVRDLDEFCMIEVDKLDEIVKNNIFNSEFKKQGFKKVVLNLNPIDDDESIDINYKNNGFAYQLPFTIDIENTKKQLKETITYANDRIIIENIEIYENGLIKGNDFESYSDALETFMELLPKLRRNIR